MSSGGGDLFAGLSMAGSSSPSKGASKKISPATTTTTTNTNPPPAGQDSKESEKNVVQPSPPPPPVSSPSQQQTAVPSSPSSIPPSAPAQRVASAPVTDKLLGLLVDDTPTSPSAATGAQKIQSQPESAAAATTNSTSSTSANDNSTPKPRKNNADDKARDEILSSAFSMESKSPTGPIKASSSFASKRNSSMNSNAKNTATAAAAAVKSSSGVGVVHPDTPIPHSDVALRLFRKFASKTRPQVPESHGGTQKLSFMRFLFSSTTSSEHDRLFDAYRDLIAIILDGDDAYDENGGAEQQQQPQNVDTNAKAMKAVASFCHLISVWGHASAHMAEAEQGTQQTFSDVLAIGFDTATSLVTHGCLDDVQIGIGPDHNEYHKAVDILSESVFASDLSKERNELSAMKFLLSTGCRVTPDNGQAMLHGSHLLQSIRVLYHVYLTTESDANKTTARASLQQLVTSVFIRMISSSPAPPSASSADVNRNSSIDTSRQNGGAGDNSESESPFPSDNHRDAFLVLRSLCKLSMRSPPSNLHSHVGLQSSGSNTTWDASRDNNSIKTPRTPGGMDGLDRSSENRDHTHHIYTQAIHPALDSKILALDLLLYVLQNTPMKGSFLNECGPQFVYAIRNYLCVSLLKNCTSDDTQIVNLSLRVFVPIIRNFRSILKNEIEAFVTNVFFVILDSKNSPIEHKSLVVTLFDEICSDPTALAEIFLNYDCDLSAVDLFHRIVNTLSKVARSLEMEEDNSSSTISLVAGAGAARMEKDRIEHRELRLSAMRALRQVLASLHASIVEPMAPVVKDEDNNTNAKGGKDASNVAEENPDKLSAPQSPEKENKKSLVEIYGSKKKRREEESEVALRFNQKPSAGIAYAAKCGHLDGTDHADVARWLLENKDRLDKTEIGDYLGREPDYQNGFCMKVLHSYVTMMDFDGLSFDDSIRLYLSGFRLPGEAQKIDRIMEKFAERYTSQNPDVFPTADVAFILAFSIIMLNTDLHNPAIKEERKMTKEGFIRNNRGICDGQDLPHELLYSIFDRIKSNPISLKEDDEAREKAGEGSTGATALPSALNPTAFFSSHYVELDRTKESNFTKERDQIVRTTESLLKRRRHSVAVEQGKGNRRRSSTHGPNRSHHIRYVRTEESGLRDEYVSPMFEVTWGPALAAFSTAMESANGTVGALLSIATDRELELAAANAAETIEVCLSGFRFAVCTAGLCGNEVARDAFMLALARFSQLGTGILLEPRHVRCIQTMLDLARSDGELLGSSWEHVFKSLSEINRFHQLFQLLARNDRVIANAANRRKERLEAHQRRQKQRQERKAAKDASDSLNDSLHSIGGDTTESEFSYGDSELFSDSDDFDFSDEMDKKEIDEANARTVYEAVSEGLIEAIYERSSSLSTNAVKEFILQLCRVSRMEISHYGGHVGSNANAVDLTQVHYRQHHTLLHQSSSAASETFHHHQPNIYNLQKLVEVSHYNMDSRPRLVFAELWTTVAAHLTSTALQNNPAVAMYAVDSFRQLSIQYLQRDELGVFEFQRRFLKPLETVMAKSEVSLTKELLLKCVERLILMFGSSDNDGNRRGMLRSGWRPILTVLGLAGRDPDEDIAQLGFAMLTDHLQQCLSHDTGENGEEKPRPGILLAERFVDLVDALLIYVEGPHEDMSIKSIDHLVTLSAFLADESFALPLVKRRQSTAVEAAGSEGGDEGSNQELELWWPILLGISRTIGDSRKNVRQKSMSALFQIISTHFFPQGDVKTVTEEKKSQQLQTLQLVYRGILTPVLEFGEAEGPDSRPPELPEDFDRFLTGPKSGEAKNNPNTKSSWLNTTFDQFLDGCVDICRKSIDSFGEDTLMEELFAMLNTCLLSDSGAVAVRGLRRLEQFISSDLQSSLVTDDTWATVSHMLRRCLSVRGLPRPSSSNALNGSSSSGSQKTPPESDQSTNPVLEEKEAIREFVMEDNMFSDRRYIGSNVVHIIGSFLSGERFMKTLGLRWRLFLISGLGKAIRDWEKAAALLLAQKDKSKIRGNPPNYLETAFYGRKYMNRFLLQISSMHGTAAESSDGGKQVNAQSVTKEQTEALVAAYLEKEEAIAKGNSSSLDSQLFNRLTSLVKDMLTGYDKLSDENLELMPWLNPVLSSFIQTGNESIRLAVQKLVKRVQKA